MPTPILVEFKAIMDSISRRYGRSRKAAYAVDPRFYDGKMKEAMIGLEEYRVIRGASEDTWWEGEYDTACDQSIWSLGTGLKKDLPVTERKKPVTWEGVSGLSFYDDANKMTIAAYNVGPESPFFDYYGVEPPRWKRLAAPDYWSGWPAWTMKVTPADKVKLVRCIARLAKAAQQVPKKRHKHSLKEIADGSLGRTEENKRSEIMRLSPDVDAASPEELLEFLRVEAEATDTYKTYIGSEYDRDMVLYPYNSDAVWVWPPIPHPAVEWFTKAVEKSGFPWPTGEDADLWAQLVCIKWHLVDMNRDSIPWEFPDTPQEDAWFATLTRARFDKAVVERHRAKLVSYGFDEGSNNIIYEWPGESGARWWVAHIPDAEALKTDGIVMGHCTKNPDFGHMEDLEQNHAEFYSLRHEMGDPDRVVRVYTLKVSADGQSQEVRGQNNRIPGFKGIEGGKAQRLPEDDEAARRMLEFLSAMEFTTPPEFGPFIELWRRKREQPRRNPAPGTTPRDILAEASRLMAVPAFSRT